MAPLWCVGSKLWGCSSSLGFGAGALGWGLLMGTPNPPQAGCEGLGTPSSSLNSAPQPLWWLGALPNAPHILLSPSYTLYPTPHPLPLGTPEPRGAGPGVTAWRWDWG